MKFYRVDNGAFTIIFDSLEEAKRYVEAYYTNRGVVLGIEEAE